MTPFDITTLRVVSLALIAPLLLTAIAIVLWRREFRDADDDWVETVRRTWWPRLDPLLRRVGGYGCAFTGEDQYVGTVALDEEALERELVAMGFERNIVAALKSRRNGDVSEGSWALRESFFASWQLHLTLYSGDGGVDVYAHWERNWRRHPWKHLDGVGFNAEKGVQMAHPVLSNRVPIAQSALRSTPNHTMEA